MKFRMDIILFLLCCIAAGILLSKWRHIFFGTELPILSYHNIIERGASDALNTNVNDLRNELTKYKKAGYTTIFFNELIDYCEGKGNLPRKPLMITFDDGYISNYEFAYPVLKELNMKATIFIVGCNAGRKTDCVTGAPLIEHFGDSAAKEMITSGVIDIQMHTFNMHRPQFNILNVKNLMTAGRYAEFLKNDTEALKAYIKKLGGEPVAFAYPYGYYNEETEKILGSIGVRATVVSTRGINWIFRNKESLFGLKRLFPVNVE